MIYLGRTSTYLVGGDGGLGGSSGKGGAGGDGGRGGDVNLNIFNRESPLRFAY